MNKNLPALIIGLVALVAVVGGAVLYQSSKSSSSASTSTQTNSAANNKNTQQASFDAIARYKSAPSGAVPAWSKGDPKSTVTIEEFADFQCPSCGQFEPTMREVKTAYGNRVNVIFRQYPLPMHDKAFDAARAAEAAGQQGKFWEMHDLIYDKQKDWSVMSDYRKTFSDYAKQLDLNVGKFENDMLGDNANSRVAADKKRGDAVGVKATPSIFLNGHLLTPDEMVVARFRQLIDQALTQK